MVYTVQVKVMPLKELLDPQGKAVMGGLANLGLKNVADVRIGKNITLQVEADNADAAKQIAEADAILAQPEFSAVNAAFDAVVAKQKRRHEPEWYKVLGKASIRAIASELERLADYVIHYGKGSQIAHSASYKDQVKFAQGAARAHPIRNLAEAHTLFSFVFCNAMHTFDRIIRFYRPDELPRFYDKYIHEWRAAFTQIPRIEIQSASAKTT